MSVVSGGVVVPVVVVPVVGGVVVLVVALDSDSLGSAVCELDSVACGSLDSDAAETELGAPRKWATSRSGPGIVPVAAAATPPRASEPTTAATPALAP